MKNFSSFYHLATCLFLILLTACGCNPDETDGAAQDSEVSLITWEECGYSIGDHMCNFSFKDQENNTFELYDNVGSPMVVDFSTMWCAYCQVAAADMGEVVDAWGHKNLIYITVLIEDAYGDEVDVDDLQSWADTFQIPRTSPILAGDRTIIDVSEENGVPVTGWPTFILLREDLVIHSGMRGYSKEGLNSMINDMIGQE